MNKFIVGILMLGLSFTACKNPNEKELIEIEALITKVIETEKELLSIDTSKVFRTKRQLELDIAEFNKIGDTLTRDDAFKISDFFGSKKKLYRLTARYPKFVAEIETSKKQLNNLKQDLENGLIQKEIFLTYYDDEEIAFKGLDFRINKLIVGIDVVVEKYAVDRPELLKLLEKLKQKAATNA